VKIEGKKKSLSTFAFSIPGNQVSHFLPERAHISPSLPFIADVPIEAFLVLLMYLSRFNSDRAFSFPNLIPGCSDNVSVFLPGYLASTLCRLPFSA